MPVFHVEPWCLREMALDLDVLAQAESVFALSNGHIGWRGNLDEGEPHGLPGSYLNGVYETRPLASNLNFVGGATVANLVVVRVQNGKVSLYNNLGSTQVVADVQGWFGPAP